jgi:RHS repeat-associated protein
LITNTNDTTVQEQVTLPFGTALSSESTGSTNRRFTSYDRSNVTGLDYAVNRTYDSQQGRFTQVDPIKMSAVSLVSPQTLNLYSYCGNDPINHVDPDGLFFKKLFKWIKKILKWIVVAVVIAVAVIALVVSPQAAVAFLKVLATFLTKIGIFKATPIIMNLAEGAVVTGVKIGLGALGKALVGLYGVGAVADFAQKKKGNPAQRRKSIIENAVISAIWRLENMPGCKEFIQGSSSHDPVSTLKTLHKDGNIFYDKNLGLAKSDPVAKVTDASGNSVAGLGTKSNIRLGTKYFDDWTVGGWRGTMNLKNTRTNILLHELKHAVDKGHAPGEANNYYYNEIAKKCFGVTP